MILNYKNFTDKKTQINENVEYDDEIRKYNHMIDYTQLDPSATEEDIISLTETARIIVPASVCVLPKMVKLSKEELQDTEIMVCTVISFPDGDNTLESKFAETLKAIKDGADEIDMVLDYKLLKKNWKDGEVDQNTHEYLSNDIKQLAELCHKHNVTLKVIVESGLLTVEQTVYTTNLCLKNGADFIKTSTGKVARGAELSKVEAMYKTIKEFGGTMYIKASGGIRTLDDIKKFLPYTDRFGIGYAAVNKMNHIITPGSSDY